VDSKTLGSWIAQATKEIPWSTGVMIWQLSNDPKGQVINDLASNLVILYKSKNSQISLKDSKLK
jgi:hypothetical protein